MVFEDPAPRVVRLSALRLARAVRSIVDGTADLLRGIAVARATDARDHASVMHPSRACKRKPEFERGRSLRTKAARDAPAPLNRGADQPLAAGRWLPAADSSLPGQQTPPGPDADIR
jgi:hypothetical protein